jgi:excisionase family DNA binding protein
LLLECGKAFRNSLGVNEEKFLSTEHGTKSRMLTGDNGMFTSLPHASLAAQDHSRDAWAALFNELSAICEKIPWSSEAALKIASATLSLIPQQPEKPTVTEIDHVEENSQRILQKIASRLATKTTESSSPQTCSLSEEVSTEDAAQFLLVSRPFVVKLIDSGELPARKVGRYRRIARADLLAYKEKMFQTALQGCQQLAKLAAGETKARSVE